MDITYDKQADAAYISLVQSIGHHQAVEQNSLIDTPNGESQLTLDFDARGRLLGIKILAASLVLEPQLLAQAELDGWVQD